MSDTAPITLSTMQATLAALCLLAIVDGFCDETNDMLSTYIDSCHQLDHQALTIVMPLIRDMADAADGVEAIMALIGDNITQASCETAYILCADYIALHGRSLPAQLRLLERLGETLNIDRLTRAALDRASLARADKLNEEESA